MTDGVQVTSRMRHAKPQVVTMEEGNWEDTSRSLRGDRDAEVEDGQMVQPK